ncbi:MAG: hypothetical protein WCR52_00495 [Bacteroidota bacterium]
MIRKHLILFTLVLFCASLTAQRTITLSNPSFEGTPGPNSAPDGWIDCGKSKESPPDIQPGAFDVVLPAFDGKTYLGLVTRDNDTWEAVGQALQEPLRTGHFYVLKIALAHSPKYLSSSRLTLQKVNFTAPVVLRIWGGTQSCDKGELLAESSLINDSEWKEHSFDLSPTKKDWDYLILEAYYKTPVNFPYNGNLLLDRVSLEEIGK